MNYHRLRIANAYVPGAGPGISLVCKDLKAGILVSLQQQQRWGLVLDLPKMQATFTNIGKEVTLELHKTRDYRVE